MRTYTPNPEEIARHQRWVLIDAKGQTLGRVATRVAHILRGKHKPQFTPHADMGDYVVLINAGEIRVTGNKAKDKMYYRHTNYPGGIKSTSFEKLLEKNPCTIIEIAVKGMLPKNPLGRDMFRKLRVYAGDKHEHAAQQPIPVSLNDETRGDK